ncbi:MAG: hypothetical protein M1834_003769 [Cirrosporium novae-zelandiae]|nr:MAG: hypothetical protein M1834_003769 [Cirrosporium novae-zelandiae]
MEEDILEPQGLQLLTEKILPLKGKSKTLAYCPSMDLVAIATENEQLHVFRLNGQRVFGTTTIRDTNLVLSRLRWKPNGKLLAAGYNDGTVRVLNAYSGKIVHRLDISADSGLEVTCLGWGSSHFRKKEGSRPKHISAGSSLGLADIFSRAQNEVSPAIYADLPRELALLDIETSLPKLSPLPSSGKEDDVFGSRVSLDAMFHTSGKQGDSVDILIAGLGNGKIHIRIFDCFLIGDFDVGKVNPEWKQYKPLLHCSNPLSSTHGVIFSMGPEGSERVYLVPIKLEFIPISGQYLPMVASKSTQLQNLLRYIQQIQEQMQAEWKSAQDLPGKYIRNANEDLEEKCNCDFVTAAYHLLVTGDCFLPLKEFLLEQVAERGHKRWEKSITTGYENIRRLALENFLPALERCAVVVSRLRGLSRFSKSNKLLGLNTQDLTNILDTLDCLTLLGHKILKDSSRELAQFTAFSAWLRQEIDVLATDPTSSSAEEIAEKDALIDCSQALGYIEGPMTKSCLNRYFERMSETKKSDIWNSEDSTIFEKYAMELESNEAQPTPGQVLGLQDLSSHLNQQCQKIFKQIAETERKNVAFEQPILLWPQPASNVMDMRMHYLEDEQQVVVYCAATFQDSSDSVRITRVTLSPDSSTRNESRVGETLLRVRDVKVQDLKIADDQFLVLLIRRAEMFADNSWPTYVQRAGHTPDPGPALEIDMMETGFFDRYVIHNFEEEAKLVPERLEIGGREGRRVVCVLFSDIRHYSVYDLDSAPEETTEGTMIEDETTISGNG